MKGESGSILPGLYDERVSRLLSKRTSWTASELKTQKLNIIQVLGSLNDIICVSVQPSEVKLMEMQRLIDISHGVVIAAVLVQDGDTEISTQATFKLNSFRTAIRETVTFLDDHAETDVDTSLCSKCNHIHNILTFLFDICANPPPRGSDKIELRKNRTSLKADHRAAILRWMARNIEDYFDKAVESCISCAYANCIYPTNEPAQSISRLRLASIAVLEKLIKDMSIESIISLDTLLFQPRDLKSVLFEVCLHLLNVGAPRAGHSSKQLATRSDDVELDIRRLTYLVLDKLFRIFPNYAVECSRPLQILFQLLPNEEDLIIPSLFCALGSLKLAYESYGRASTNA